VCTEPLNDVNKAGVGCTSHPVDTLNIAASDAGNVSDVQRLMHGVAAEMHADARRAIDELKQDRDLWSRVEQLKQDAATRPGDASEPHSTVGLNAGVYYYLCV